MRDQPNSKYNKADAIDTATITPTTMATVDSMVWADTPLFVGIAAVAAPATLPDALPFSQAVSVVTIVPPQAQYRDLTLSLLVFPSSHHSTAVV